MCACICAHNYVQFKGQLSRFLLPKLGCRDCMCINTLGSKDLYSLSYLLRPRNVFKVETKLSGMTNLDLIQVF